VRDIICDYDYTHLYGTGLEIYIDILGKEDASIGYRYSLDTLIGYRSMRKKLQRDRSFSRERKP
jgi:hypothetical protein